MDSRVPKYRHDAFISYSRRDADFSKSLEAALENFRTPKDLPFPQRHLDIFPDESDFTGTAYHESVKRHLEESATLIVICSPDAAQSGYVEDEIQRFAGDDPHRQQKIIPVLYRGIPKNEAGPANEKAFPVALCEFMGMPLGIDYRGFDPKKHRLNRGIYENSWYTVLANICGVSRAEIEERDRRRRSRIKRLQVSAATVLFVSLSIALIITLISRHQAVREQHLAESGRLSANALNVLSVDPQLSLLLGFEAAMLSYSSSGKVSLEAQDALHRALSGSRERLSLSGHSGLVSAVAFSPDGRVLATADATEVRLWDTVNGSRLPLRLEGAGPVIGLAFSPDGSRLATAGKDHIARLWDVTSGRQLRTFSGLTRLLWSVAFSPDGTRLATASRDATVKVWDLASGHELQTLVGHTSDVNTVAYSPDGKLLATGGADGAARIWDAVSGRQLHELSGEGSILAGPWPNTAPTRAQTTSDSLFMPDTVAASHLERDTESAGSFVAYASIATGQSEPVTGQGLHRLKSKRVFTAHLFAA
jgi:WD40 repeat protein